MNRDKEALLAEVERLAAERGLTLSAVALAAGLGRDTLTKAKTRKGGLSLPTIQKLMDYLRVSSSELIPASAPPAPILRGEVRLAPGRKLGAPMVKDLPVMGTAAGAIANNGFEITNQIVEYRERPPGLVGVPDAYAIYVKGESMTPEHHPGDLRFVHPYRPYKRDDSVIIQLRAHETAPLEGYIKTFLRETADELVVSQHNPKAEITYAKATIVSVHKVMTQNELF